MDKELLFAPRLPEDTVEVPGFGAMRVRGLSRAEVLLCQGSKGIEAFERKMISLGLVDPALTEAEVGRWQKAALTTELTPVSDKIAELSGLAQGATKRGVPADGEPAGD